jgi:hypothetical protein
VPALEKRRRRRNERNAAQYDDDVLELLQAIDVWRTRSGRSFPAWSEVLQMLKELGWRKPEADATAAIVPVEPIPVQEPTSG